MLLAMWGFLKRHKKKCLFLGAFLGESKECFICREGDEMGRDALLHFCDCKNLIAHQKCLLTWIQKSPPIEDTPRCKVCTAEYQLEKTSPWGILVWRWHEWVILCTILAVMICTPVLVYQMMIAFKDPPPNLVFHIAAVCFGALTEILLANSPPPTMAILTYVKQAGGEIGMFY